MFWNKEKGDKKIADNQNKVAVIFMTSFYITYFFGKLPNRDFLVVLTDVLFIIFQLPVRVYGPVIWSV